MNKSRSSIPVLLILIFLLGTLIRFTNLTEMILYWDEPIHSVRIDHQILPYVLAHNNAGAFFAVLVHFLLPMGNLELAARLPSAVFGSLLILAMYFAGMTFFSKKTGLTAAALMAFSPFFIRFSQYSRGYATFTFFAVLALCFLWKAREKGGLKYWAGYTLLTIPALYTHLMGFLSLTGLALSMGIFWIVDCFISRAPVRRKTGNRSFWSFAIATFAAVSATGLLYLADENVKGFLTASVDRVNRPLPFGYIASYLTKKIFSTQWELHQWAYPVVIILLGLGLLTGFKSRGRRTILLSLYILIPFLIFIRINPREVNIQSAPRYFVFALPALLLLTAWGIERTSEFFSTFARGRKQSVLNAAVMSTLTLVILAGFDHGHYYRNFWRLGSLKIPGEVRSCLNKNVTRDGLLYIPGFPSAGLNLMINPLTRAPEFRSSEQEIRPGLEVTPGENPVMIYRGVTPVTELLGRDIGVWAVIPEPGSRGEEFQPRLSRIPDVRTYPLSSHLVVHFRRSGENLGRNLLDLTETLSAGESRSLQWKELRLKRVLILIAMGREEEALRDLQLLDPEPSAEVDPLPPSSRRLFRLLDPLLGVDPVKFKQFYFDYFFQRDIGTALFRLGEAGIEREDYSSAANSLREAARWNPEYIHPVANRLIRIAGILLSRGEPGPVPDLFLAALRLQPDRIIIHGLAAEAYKSAGREDAAGDQWPLAIPGDSIPKAVFDRLAGPEPLVLIFSKESTRRLVFRAPAGTMISGEIRGEQITDIQGEFLSRDSGIKSTNDRIRLDFRMDAKRIKALEFRVPEHKNIQLEFRINGRRNPNQVILIPPGNSPRRIPFTLPQDKEQ